MSTSARWVLSLLAILVLGGGVLVTNDVLGGGQGLFHAAPASSPTAAITGEGPTTRVAGHLGHALPGILAGLYVAHRRRNKRWLFRPRLSF